MFVIIIIRLARVRWPYDPRRVTRPGWPVSEPHGRRPPCSGGLFAAGCWLAYTPSQAVARTPSVQIFTSRILVVFPAVVASHSCSQSSARDARILEDESLTVKRLSLINQVIINYLFRGCWKVWCARLDRDPSHSAHGFGQQVAWLVLRFGLDDWVATRTPMLSPHYILSIKEE